MSQTSGWGTVITTGRDLNLTDLTPTTLAEIIDLLTDLKTAKRKNKKIYV